MMSQHGRLVNVKSHSSQNHSADDNLTRKSDSAPTAYFDILDIFKGEAKVNVNVTVYTNVSGLLKVNIGEYLREKIFLQAQVTTHPAFKRQDRLGKEPFAGFGTVVEDITESGYTKNQPILLGAF